MKTSFTQKESVVVTANAGTGKTTHLLKRMTALLIQGASTSEVLCLTYTRNATKEIRERLEKRFSEMASSSDDNLLKKLKELFLTPSQSHVSRAKNLFMEIFSSSESLRIQTIHAFCEDFLKRRGIHRTLARPEEEEEILREAQERLLKKDPSIPWKDLCHNQDYSTFQRHAKQLLKERYWLEPLLGNRPATTPLSVPSKKERIQAHDHLTKQFHRHKAQWEHIYDLLLKGSETDNHRAKLLKSILQEKKDVISCEALFFTQNGTLKKRLLPAKMPKEFHEVAQDFAQNLQKFLWQKELSRTSQDTQMWSIFGEKLFQEYSRICREKELITYDALLLKTLSLFKQEKHNPYSLFDQKTIHLLIDEAQDLSLIQWEIVEHIKEEVLGASGSSFIVGDPKQSIYRFQGAHYPKFQHICHDAEKENALDILNVSYRSVPCLMRFVDALFTKIEEQKSSSQEWASHQTKKSGGGGIFLYDPPKEQTRNQKETDAPEKMTPQEHKALINHLVIQVKSLLKKTIKPEEIMILFPSRTQMFYDVIDALKAHKVSVAEPDRYHLGEHLIIWDLLACGHLALCPENDIMLACVLKKLFHWEEKDILTLRPPLKENPLSLFRCLEEKAKQSQEEARILDFLHELQDNASLNSMEFYQRLLNRKITKASLKEHILSSQEDARIVLDLFMDHLFQEQHLPLRTFLATLEMTSLTIKRESPPHAVRVMTIHGAKGMEAEAVFVLDSWKKPHSHNPFLQIDHHKDFLYIAKEYKHPHIKNFYAQRKVQEQEEQERLLYVALTRAKTYLYLYMPPVKTSTPWHMFRSIIKNWKKQHSYQRINDMLVLEGEDSLS